MLSNGQKKMKKKTRKLKKKWTSFDILI
jgi:hypothetical protein